MSYRDLVARVRAEITEVETSTAERLKAWAEAPGARERAELVRKWDKERIALDTLRSVAYVRFELDTRDPGAKAEKEFFDDAAPRLTELDLSFVKKVVDDPDREGLADDVGVSAEGSGFSGFTLAHNVGDEAEVDRVLAEAVEAGGTLVKPAQKVFWGGYSGYFADPDGHLWEVAHNPFFPLDADGRVQLPPPEV